MALVDLLDAWVAPAPPPGADGALDGAIAELSLVELAALADDLRAGGGRVRVSWRWHRIDPRDARRFLERAPGLGLAGLLSLHRNGYVRQVGLEALAGFTDPRSLRFFALRLDDIVPILRDRARAEIERRIAARNAGELAALLPLLRRLSLRTRAGTSAVLREIELFLVDPEGGREALLAATKASDPSMRLAACALAVKRAELGEDLVPLLDAALHDPDRRLSRWAAMEITSTRASEATRARLLPRLDVHRDPFFRRRAVLARAREPEAKVHLSRALLDPRAAVRRAAREKLHDVSSRELYLHVLGATLPIRKDVLGALAGLAEVGRAEDAPVVLRWIEVNDPPLQAEAVRCLGHLDAAAHRDRIEACRASPYARVRREAERALGAAS